jgi:hypothetical protein
MRANAAGPKPAFKTLFRSAAVLGAISAVLALVLLSSCGEDGGPAGTGPGRPVAWTFMLYDAADINDAYDPMEDFSSRMSSGSDLRVLVFRDTRGDSARIWAVGSDHVASVVSQLGEVNTGRSETLRSFLAYAKSACPADRYILALYGHGQGWLGACLDASNGNDYLTMEEMRSAISAEGGVDLVMFTGPCLMGAVECAYELRNCCDIYVASENLSYYCWWDHPMEDICETLKGNPSIENRDLAAAVIDFIYADSGRWAGSDWGQTLTMSAIGMDRIEDVVTAWNSLAEDYLKRPARLRDAMDSTGLRVTVFCEQYPDIYDLATEVITVETADSTRARLAAVIAGIESAVLAECHADSLEGARGLTVYFPFRSHSGSTALYSSQTGLDFITGTSWDEFLVLYPYPAD